MRLHKFAFHCEADRNAPFPFVDDVILEIKSTSVLSTTEDPKCRHLKSCAFTKDLTTCLKSSNPKLNTLG